MRKWIIWIVILLLLAGGGFCLYWFVFRDTSDGGNLTNREALFVIQNVLEDNNVDLKDYIDNPQKVEFDKTATNAVVYADGKEVLPLSEKFSGVMAINRNANCNNFKVFEQMLVLAWKNLYSNVFGGVKNIRQNVWYENIITEKVMEEDKEVDKEINRIYLKIWSNKENDVYIWFYDKSADELSEIVIGYDYRSATPNYDLTMKSVEKTKSSEEGQYRYSLNYFCKNNGKVAYCDSATFYSNKEYKQINQEYELISGEYTLFSNIGIAKRYFKSPKGAADDTAKEIFKYMIEDYDITFYHYDQFSSAKKQTMKQLVEFKK